MRIKLPKFALLLAMFFLKRKDKRRIKKFKKPANVEYFEDIPYINDGLDCHKFDFYRPDISNGKTIIDIHGGGFIYGNRKLNLPYCSYYASKGFNVFNVDYSCANNKKNNLEQLKELASFLVFLKDHEKKYGLDLSNIILAGDSAGGLFALLLYFATKDEALFKKVGIKGLKRLNISHIILSSSIFDLETLVKEFSVILTKGVLKFMSGSFYLDSEYLHSLNPYQYFYKYQLPPIFLSSSSYDFLKNSSDAIVASLKEKNIPHQYYFLETTNKKYGHVFNVLCIPDEESEKCLNASIDFVLSNN